MRISPLDIQQQQFKGKMFGGLDPEDVDQFLQTVAEAMEELLREIAELKAEAPLQPLEPPPHAVTKQDEADEDIRATLLAAHRVIETLQGNAQKEADLLLTEAHQKAQHVIESSQQQRIAIQAEIASLAQQRLQLDLELKAVLETHMRLISARA